MTEFKPELIEAILAGLVRPRVIVVVPLFWRCLDPPPTAGTQAGSSVLAVVVCWGLTGGTWHSITHLFNPVHAFID